MLNKKRIEKAQHNVSMYLHDGLLKKTTDHTAQKILIKNAHDSIQAAKLLMDNTIPLWTIVCSYYSMFYIANAVLLTHGYKVEHKVAHKVTADALIALIRNKLKKQLLEQYENIQEEAMGIAEIKICFTEIMGEVE